MKKYESKGAILFVAQLGKHQEFCLGTMTYEKEQLLSNSDKDDMFNRFRHDIYDLMSGEDFLESVDRGSLIDYDGSIAQIFVDGYKSNLGLTHEGITQGDFLVTKECWLDLCSRYDIEVNWANR